MEPKPLYIKDRKTWRKWLERNHDRKKEVWILYYKVASNKPRIPYYDAVDEALCFGWIDGKVKSIDELSYKQRFTPRRKKSLWSAINAQHYISLLKQGLVTKAGKRVFKDKLHIIPHRKDKPGAYQWHLDHKMGSKPSLETRINWHKEHQKHCGCRPIPSTLAKYFH